MSENAFNLEWAVEEAFVVVISNYRQAGYLPRGLGVRHWQDVRTLPPGQYVMAHATNKDLCVSNRPIPLCLAPCTVELGVFSDTIPDSSGMTADRIRGVLAYQLIPGAGFMAALVAACPLGLSLQAVKRTGTHDYSENPRIKIRYVTLELFGEIAADLAPQTWPQT